MKNKIANVFSFNPAWFKIANRQSKVENVFTLVELLACQGVAPRAKRSIKFTLIELLVVISIIAILAGLLLPALSMAKKKAHTMQCMGNQKQCALSMTLYTDDWRGFFPAVHGVGAFDDDSVETMEWWQALADYGMKRKYLLCPEDKAVEDEFIGAEDRISYVCNAMYLHGQKKDMIKDCSKRVMFSERGDTGTPDPDDPGYEDSGYNSCCYKPFYRVGIWENNIKKYRHGKMANYPFVDGHVETLKFEDTVGNGSVGQNRHFVSEYLPTGSDYFLDP
jgi:prepilin-type N-terminal cleavage/methylation domain-containing protein/prepilin-type processing-associated H-X9-DG protein